METVVLLFTDVEGSTRAWATSPGMARSLEQHDAILRQAFRAHHGVEFKHTGDGLCVTFPSVRDAVLGAVASQRALTTADWSEGPRLHVRMAIHVGTAHRRGDDWFGLSLSRCARLMGAAHGGQVLVSSSAASLLAEAPAKGVTLADLGAAALRDFPAPEQVWQVVAPDLRREFPPLHTPSTAKGNLPAELSPIIGRARAIDQVCDALRRSRLVTLTGTGGVGKTRLARAAAGTLAAEFDDGVWLVELASAQASDDVDLLVAATAAVPLTPGTSVRESIRIALGGKRVLFLLDNCEHVIDGVADLVGELLSHCASLAIIATSREPLGADGERTIAVPSLDIDSEAVALFLARADAAVPAFEADDPAAISEICQRLDGIPLAIELAAVAVRTLRPAEIADRLRDHIDVLTSGRRGRIERHATVRAAIDWSWSLLGPDERLAFTRLSVFAGGFDLPAAAAVVGEVDPVDMLTALVEKSMVLADGEQAAPFRLLEPLRQYAAERLAAEGLVEEVARRHAEHYATLASRLSLMWESSDEVAAVTQLGSARDNLRAAFAFAAAQRDGDLCLRIVAPLSDYATTQAWAEAWAWADTALEVIGPGLHPLKVDTLLFASRGAWQRGDLVQSLSLADSALDMVVEGSEAWRYVQELRSGALIFLGRIDEAAAAAADSVGDPPHLETYADLRRMCSHVLMQAGRESFDTTLDTAMHALARAKEMNLTAHALALFVVGMVIAPTDRRAAVECGRASADLSAVVGSALVHGFAMALLASAEASSDPAESVRGWTDVMGHYLGSGNRLHIREFGRALVAPLAECRSWEAAAIVEGATRDAALFAITLGDSLYDAIDRVRDEIGDEYERCARRGAAMSDDELVAYVTGVASQLGETRP
ncbi:MAG TPA: NB-ARC domain-containing protein [Acidimicrobiales bacterium]|nr:NB-ARC domain-containing protein [Acidimicrobiales bacterium]